MAGGRFPDHLFPIYRCPHHFFPYDRFILVHSGCYDTLLSSDHAPWAISPWGCALVVLARHFPGHPVLGDIVEIEFTVAELKLGNPHDRVVAIDDENNRWNLLLAPPARNRRFGFDETTLQVGDLIQVTGAKHSSKLEIKVHCINVDGENVYTYRYDNGKSSFERLRIDQSCE